MINRKLLAGVLLVSVIAVQIGCSPVDNSKGVNGSGTKQEETNKQAKDEKEKQAAIAADFKALVDKESGVQELIGFIDKNISSVSKDVASIMITGLEEAQKKYLPDLEKEFYSDVSIQEKMLKEYPRGFDMGKIDNVKDEKLKKLLVETRDSGYKVETAEGMYFPIINYQFYKKYSSYATPDIAEYVNIMSVESDKVPAKDAAIVIGWDEVLNRASSQEKFLEKYGDSIRADDIKELYKKYVTFALYGANNTPMFSYGKKLMDNEAKGIYAKVAASNEGGKLKEIIAGFFDTVKKNGYKLTDEVDQYRKGIIDNIK
ncbi:MAG: hypothetical protein ACM3TR_16490 [Caulobacteraceae bacterium]